MTFSFFLLYNIIRVPLFALMKVAGLFNAKIRKTLKGRAGLYQKLEAELLEIPADAQRVWIHISSMGEFEQGVPLIRELLSRSTDRWIIVSLFSPSAYEHVRFQEERTVITYLPFDSFQNARKFTGMVKPDVAVIVRHDIWPNYQWVLQRAGIPSILVDASISDDRLVSTKRFRSIFRQVYSTFSSICSVSDINTERLHAIYPVSDKIITCGDTRYDRVYNRAVDTSKIQNLLDSGNFVREKCFVAGSTWPNGEKILFPGFEKAFKKYKDFTLIIAPHEITDERMASIERYWHERRIKVIRLSVFEKDATTCRVLLVDRIGLLANLYALGAMAYVGGGFGVGVHSVLEPAAHGAVTSYGPRHLNSPEAKEMTAQKIGHPIVDDTEFETFLLDFLANPHLVSEVGGATKEYVLKNVGASRRTADVIEKFLTLKIDR